VIVITADRRKRELAAALERRGATVHHAPALSTIPHLDDARLVDATRLLIETPPDIVVATTGVGFRAWVEAADAAGIADELLEAMNNARIIARGPKARGAIQAAGLEADWVAETETARELQEYLLAEGVAGARIAVQHHGNGSDGLDEAFAAAGADVQSLVVYGWGPPLDPAAHRQWIEAAATGGCDAVLFTSAPGAAAWVASVNEWGFADAVASASADGRLLLESVGPVTAKPLLDAGFVSPFPDRWRLGALVREVVKYYGDDQLSTPTRAGVLTLRATTAVLDGKALPLSPSGLAILKTLAKANGSVVTREQLAAAMPTEQSGAHAVEAAINRLRDASRARTLVKTIVKRGYALAVAS
jgi:uroporphyrinogen-III synthase